MWVGWGAGRPFLILVANADFFDCRSVMEQKVTLPQKAKEDSTQCSQIIPFALGNFDDANASETENKALICWTLYRYSPGSQGKIYTASINQL